VVEVLVAAEAQVVVMLAAQVNQDLLFYNGNFYLICERLLCVIWKLM
jgi:hypothetical protein